MTNDITVWDCESFEKKKRQKDFSRYQTEKFKFYFVRALKL